MVRRLLLFDDVFLGIMRQRYRTPRTVSAIAPHPVFFISPIHARIALELSCAARNTRVFFSLDGRFVSLQRSGLYGRILVEEARMGVWG